MEQSEDYSLQGREMDLLLHFQHSVLLVMVLHSHLLQQSLANLYSLPGPHDENISVVAQGLASTLVFDTPTWLEIQILLAIYPHLCGDKDV